MPQRKPGKATRKPARSTARTTRRAATRPNPLRGHAASGPATRSAAPQVEPAADEASPSLASLAPHELYRHEKRRRADQRRDTRDPLEEARRVFKAMIEAGVGTPRGGRPRKVKPQPEDRDE